MTIDEYTNEVKRILKDDYNFDDDYINKLDNSIIKSYYDKVKLSETVNEDRIDLNEYCYGVFMMYPDIP